MVQGADGCASQAKETLLVRSWPRCRWSTPSVRNFAAVHTRTGGCRCSRARSKQSHSLGFCPRAVVLTPAFKVVSPCRIVGRVDHSPGFPRRAIGHCHTFCPWLLRHRGSGALVNRRTVRIHQTLLGVPWSYPGHGRPPRWQSFRSRGAAAECQAGKTVTYIQGTRRQDGRRLGYMLVP